MTTLEYLKQPELGKTARELRRQHHISMTTFAESIGVTRQTVYNFEHGITQSMELLQAYLRLRGEGNDDTRNIKIELEGNGENDARGIT